jgi:HTH-type transcriptional regulator/antitoxin HigA
MTTLKPIRNEEAYDQALARIEELWDAADGSAEADELEVLSLLVAAYEKDAHPIAPPDPIDAILFAMEQRGLKPKDLESIIGPSGRVSEVLGKRRTLTLPMIRRIEAELGVEPAVLIREYRPLTKRGPAKRSGQAKSPRRKPR